MSGLTSVLDYCSNPGLPAAGKAEEGCPEERKTATQAGKQGGREARRQGESKHRGARAGDS